MFAHDCLIFCKATKRAVRMITDILKNPEMVSGQVVNQLNLQKSRIEFSKGIENGFKGEITNIFILILVKA